MDGKRQQALAVHGVYCISNQIFHNPSEENRTGAYPMGLAVGNPVNFYGNREAFGPIAQHVGQPLLQAHRFQRPRRAHFAESIGNHLQPLDVAFHLGHGCGGYVLLLEQGQPPQQSRQGGAQLVRGLPGHAGPYPVLFGPAGARKCPIRQQHKKKHDAQQHPGVDAESVQHQAFGPVHVLKLPGGKFCRNGRCIRLHPGQSGLQLFYRTRLPFRQVPVRHDAALFVHQHDRNAGVAFQNAVYKLQIARKVGIYDGGRSIRPQGHAGLFFLPQPRRKPFRVPQGER